MVKLTIGMATYDDFNGVYFTIQSLRSFFPMTRTSEVEFIVVDNNPTSAHGEATKNFLKWVKNSKYIEFEEKKSTSIRNEIFKNASGQYTICLDPHVILQPGSIESLLDYYDKNPNCKNLIQGPMLYDDLINYSTEFKPIWNDHMFGTWNANKEAQEKGDPFEIPMMGLGTFSCETKNWLGFNEEFKGFGAEEWYIHEKYRRNGGKAICLPDFKWLHRFGRPDGVPYPLVLEDRIWNYYIGWLEFYDIDDPMMIEMYEYLKTIVNVKILNRIKQEAIKYYANKKP